MLVRHGHRPLIGAALAHNPAFPTDALFALRRSTEAHWLVDTAVADRADVPLEMLIEIARLAREPAVGMAVVGNEKSDSATLDALVQSPVRMDTALENALAAHPDLSVQGAARLAGRHATNVVGRLAPDRPRRSAGGVGAAPGRSEHPSARRHGGPQ